jgi:enoyl-CoA hydratase
MPDYQFLAVEHHDEGRAARITPNRNAQTVDNMGFFNSLQACFTMQERNHAHRAVVHENGIPAALPEDGVPTWSNAPPVVLAALDKVRD